MTPGTAVEYGLSGVNLRCTGVKRDLRRDRPYSIYDRFDFDVPVATDGDCQDRFFLRMEEILYNPLDRGAGSGGIPDGPTMAETRGDSTPTGRGLLGGGKSRGELGV